MVKSTPLLQMIMCTFIIFTFGALSINPYPIMGIICLALSCIMAAITAVFYLGLED